MGCDHGVQPEAKAPPKTVGGHRCWDQVRSHPGSCRVRLRTGVLRVCGVGLRVGKGSHPGSRAGETAVCQQDSEAEKLMGKKDTQYSRPMRSTDVEV